MRQVALASSRRVNFGDMTKPRARLSVMKKAFLDHEIATMHATLALLNNLIIKLRSDQDIQLRLVLLIGTCGM